MTRRIITIHSILCNMLKISIRGGGIVYTFMFNLYANLRFVVFFLLIIKFIILSIT